MDSTRVALTRPLVVTSAVIAMIKVGLGREYENGSERRGIMDTKADEMYDD